MTVLNNQCMRCSSFLRQALFCAMYVLFVLWFYYDAMQNIWNHFIINTSKYISPLSGGNTVLRCCRGGGYWWQPEIYTRWWQPRVIICSNRRQRSTFNRWRWWWTRFICLELRASNYKYERTGIDHGVKSSAFIALFSGCALTIWHLRHLQQLHISQRERRQSTSSADIQATIMYSLRSVI